MFSATSLEAQKLISVSIGKMNASRVTRTGASLHRSLLVATVLHKARNIYFEEERERVAKFPPPEVTVTPVCHLNNPHLNVNTINPHSDNKRSECPEDDVVIPECVSEQSKLPSAEANTDNNITHTTNTTTTVTSTNSSTVTTSTTNLSQNRKRRRVSDQETAAAVSSILPKRLRSELREETQGYERSESDNGSTNFALSDCTTNVESRENIREITGGVLEGTPLPGRSAGESSAHCDDHLPRIENIESTGSTRLREGASPEEKSGSSSDDSDSDDENSTEIRGSCEEMEVDQLTSLVSFFSFSQSQKQSEYCISPIHPTGPHVVALTA